ncbi:MAG: DUF4835 family protein [Prevotellaceae bacterium]|nr:DUF4835 family protein [Prevotellaceae bacterium]
MRKGTATLLAAAWMLGASLCPAQGQELNARVNINRSQVSNTKGEVFDALQKTMADFLNNHKWTELTFRDNEKIQCTFNLTVSTYSDTDNSFVCSLLLSSTRPVYGSSYTTTGYSVKDPQFTFTFKEHDQLEFNINNIDNNLVALLAYYAYVIIGMDMDTMAPKGGTPYLQTAEQIVQAGQALDFPGWKAFDDSKNRFGLLNDYMDGAMESMRQFEYVYHRKGLDRMATAPDSARVAIAEGLELLREAHQAKTMSQVPQLFTEYKREELLNIFADKGTKEEREKAYEILFAIDASQNESWKKLKK